MANVIVRHAKNNEIRGVVVGYAAIPTTTQGEDGKMVKAIQPLIGVAWFHKDHRYPAVQTHAQEDLVTEEISEGDMILDEWTPEEDATAHDAVIPAVTATTDDSKEDDDDDDDDA